jgi:hypothetical protein
MRARQARATVVSSLDIGMSYFSLLVISAQRAQVQQAIGAALVDSVGLDQTHEGH